MPVCKVKYQPHRPEKRVGSTKGARVVGASGVKGCGGGGDEEGGGGAKTGEGEQPPQEQMFACHLHHLQRKARIDKAGPRRGWQSFEVFHRAAAFSRQRAFSGGSDTSSTAATMAVLEVLPDGVDTSTSSVNASGGGGGASGAGDSFVGLFPEEEVGSGPTKRARIKRCDAEEESVEGCGHQR